jgi:hypothetical protein
MREFLFEMALWVYPGLAILYGFWAMLAFGRKNVLSGRWDPAVNGALDAVVGILYVAHSVTFYLLYFVTRDLPIDASAFSFTVRMWWTVTFGLGLSITLWRFGHLALTQWRLRRMAKREEGNENG